ncbi:hypothetical protein L7F22_028551 [Adiantum nelumboides]|nr:hypothetical protein [Adiantum nelumboides]
MDEPGGFRHRRRQKRPPSCRFGCLGCLNYKSSSSAPAPQDEVTCSYSDEDEHPSKRERSLDDIYKNGPTSFFKSKAAEYTPAKCELECEVEELEKTPYDNMVCKVCKKGDADAEMLLCDGCDEGFHIYCLCPILIKVPKGKWFCSFCSKKEKISGHGTSEVDEKRSVVQHSNVSICGENPAACGMMPRSVECPVGECVGSCIHVVGDASALSEPLPVIE